MTLMKCFVHPQELTQHCITVLSACFYEIIGSEDWAKDWLELDRDQLTEFLKCNDLTVPSEGKSLFRAAKRSF